MEFIYLPDEIIIMIAQFIGPTKYNHVCLKRWTHEVFPQLLSIYDLVCTCKRFEFLRHETFLIFNKPYIINHFKSVNYLGFYNGPCYGRHCNNWFFYGDKKTIVAHYSINIDNTNYNVLGKKENRHDIDFKKLCSEIYQGFNDQEILKFVKECENQQNMRVMLIRKRFPKLEIKKSQIRKIIQSCIFEKQ